MTLSDRGIKLLFAAGFAAMSFLSVGCEKTNEFLQKIDPPAKQQKDAPPQPPPTLNSISGHVVDAFTNGSIADAKVQVFLSNGALAAWATTNTSGDYSIANLVAGNYSVQISKSGYVGFQTSNPGSVSGGAVAIVNASMNQIPNTIHGRVTDARLNLGISAAQVQLFNAATGALIASIQTDGSGSYSIPGVLAGNYKMQFSKVGFFELSINDPGLISGGNAYTVDAALSPKKVTISGHVLDVETNAGLANTQVSVLSDNGAVVANGRTDVSGNYIFSELYAGKYSMKFSIVGYNDLLTSSPGDTVGGNTYIVNASMGQIPNTIHGRVTDAQLNLGISAAQVQLFNAATGALVTSVQTDGSGNYSINRVLVGNYKMQFSKVGYSDFSTNSPGQVIGGVYTVDAALNPKKITISGHVTDLDTNASLASVQVSVFSSNGVTVATGRTDAGGNYIISDLSSGNYSMKFSLAGYNENTTSSPGDTIGGNSYVVDSAMKIKLNSIIGHVVDASNAYSLPGARVQLINAITGTVYASADTDNAGNYSINNVPNGNYKMLFSRQHYADYSTNEPGMISGGNTYTVNAAMSQTLDPGQYRIVLTWTDGKYGAVRDVDSYLQIPGDRAPIYYNRKTGTGANLDVDDTDWRGPETVTILQQQSGIYHYYIANYSDPSLSDALGKSDVIVSVYGVRGLEKQYTLVGGIGLAYEFFKIENGAIVDVKQYTTSLPYCTANNPNCAL